jgi:hypothetical protein
MTFCDLEAESPNKAHHQMCPLSAKIPILKLGSRII